MRVCAEALDVNIARHSGLEPALDDRMRGFEERSPNTASQTAANDLGPAYGQEPPVEISLGGSAVRAKIMV